MSNVDKKQWAETYPMSIVAWELSDERISDFMITETEKTYYEVEVSDYAYFFQRKMSEELHEEITKLKAENEMMRKGLEFYSGEAWVEMDGSPNHKVEAAGKDCEWYDHTPPFRACKLIGGKKAREILKKIDENKKEVE